MGGRWKKGMEYVGMPAASGKGTPHLVRSGGFRGQGKEETTFGTEAAPP